MDRKQQLEEQMTQSLIEGEMSRRDPGTAAQDRLTPRYELRIQTSRDPIVEETLKYRSMAEEVDGRYDDYMRRSAQSRSDEERTAKGIEPNK